jgi:hypothetical protein
VSILFSEHGADRRQRDFRRRAGGIGREAVSKKSRDTTRLGTTIVAPLRGMCRWAKRYHKKVSADVHLPEAYEVQ